MKLTSTLYREQQPALAKAVRRKFLLNCMKVGTGKTIISLATCIELFNRGSIELIIILARRNAYEFKHWEKEIKKHTDQISQDLEHLVKTRTLISRFIVGKHSHVKNYSRQLRSLISKYKTMIIVDEVMAFKSPFTELTLKMKAVKWNAVAVHCLTATPLSRNLEDTYNILDFTRPGCLGTFDNFKSVYCNTHQEVVGRTNSGSLRKIEVITGFKDEALFNRVTDSFILKSENTVSPKFHFVPYQLSSEEFRIYHTIAKGISLSPDESIPVTWLQTLLKDSQEESPTDVKMVSDLTAHSSRFIYLQYAADGIVNQDGTLGRYPSTKYNYFLDICKTIAAKKQSAVLYFSYYACLETFEYQLKRHLPNVRIIRSTGQDVLEADQVTEKTVSKVPHFILSTKAGSESVSYYFINNVILVNIPTVPDTFVQIIGRITRVNTLFPDDLNVYLPRCANIDDYKLFVISHKTGIMETVAGKESNVPELFKDIDWRKTSVKRYKNTLLWYKQHT